jgi:integrase
MLLLCARLGLGPSEVLRLRLQDPDWTTGSVLIRAGKTSRERVLPLPQDAGAVLASYLHEARPISTERAVFLSCGPAHPPIRGNGFMAKLVNRLLRQAGIGAPCSGAYVLRQTLATAMVRSGASFKEFVDILGHGFAHHDRDLRQTRPAVACTGGLTLAARRTMNPAQFRVHIEAYLNLRSSLGFQTEYETYNLRARRTT